MKRGVIMRLLMAFMILASVFLRPAGMMLAFDGETLSYEICTGGEARTVRVALGGEPQETRDIGCDFFAAQVGALPLGVPGAIAEPLSFTRLVSVALPDRVVLQVARVAHAPRAPPFMS